MSLYARIAGTGGYLPERVLTNQQIADSGVDTSDEWIQERTGIRQRRIAAIDETASSMGEHAAREALTAAGLEPESLDLIIVRPVRPTGFFPAPLACCNTAWACVSAPRSMCRRLVPVLFTR